MSNVIVKENETLDSALRRFKRSCAKAGIQQEIRKREHYEKPSVKRKKKSEAARKRKYNKCKTTVLGVITGDFVLMRETKCGIMKYWEQISII